jgi:hypothetical protein
MPEYWAEPGTVTVNVRDMNATVLATGSATVTAETTLASAVVRMDKTAVLTADMGLSADDVVRVGSVDLGYQQMVVKSYTSSTKTVEFTDRFDSGYPIGAAIEARDCSFSVDTSSWESNVYEVSVEWVPDTDDLPIVNVWRVLNRTQEVGGLEEKFRILYQTENNAIPPGGFVVFQDQARSTLATLWASKGLDLDKLVGNDEEYEGLMLRLIAKMVNPSEENMDDFNSYYSTVCSLEKWIDDDQDLDQDESEIIKGQPFQFQRKM